MMIFFSHVKGMGPKSCPLWKKKLWHPWKWVKRADLELKRPVWQVNNSAKKISFGSFLAPTFVVVHKKFQLILIKIEGGVRVFVDPSQAQNCHF